MMQSHYLPTLSVKKNFLRQNALILEQNTLVLQQNTLSLIDFLEHASFKQQLLWSSE